MKYFICVLLMMVILIGSSTGVGLAESKSVPVFMNIAPSVVDFEITQKIHMTAENAGSPTLSIDDLSVTNIGKMGLIKVDSIAVSAADGWTLAPDNTDFINMPADQQTFSFVADGIHDFGKDQFMISEASAGPGESATVKFTGKTGPVTAEIQDIQVAVVTVTVSLG